MPAKQSHMRDSPVCPCADFPDSVPEPEEGELPTPFTAGKPSMDT